VAVIHVSDSEHYDEASLSTIDTRNHRALLAGGEVDFTMHTVFSTVCGNGIPGRSIALLLRLLPQ
jgi:hypothetical protein